MTKLLIRADASAQIGSGHLMRCLALGQAWRAYGGTVTFLSQCESDALRRWVESAGLNFVPLERSYPHPHDLQATLLTLEELVIPWLVLDGYHFDTVYQRAIRRAGHRLLAIDDTAHLPRYHADLVLNQNINAEQLRYRCDPDTQLLLGTRYTLLRSEFLAWRDWHREAPHTARRILVTLGGSDPENVTLKVIRALQELDIPRPEARIVVGPSNPHLQLLRQAVERSTCDLQILTAVKDMPELMAWADVAVSAGGSTCWELAFMGLPNIVLMLAANQEGVAAGLEANGVILNVGWHASVNVADLAKDLNALLRDAARRREMSKRGRQLVDGYGAARVTAIITGAGG